MSFAEKILKKFGWKEGNGLGKTSDGIAKPLKASMKFDNAGFGHDAAEEFKDHWWERCYNDAARNIGVDVERNDEANLASKESNKDVKTSAKSCSINKRSEKHEVSGIYSNHFRAASSAIPTNPSTESNCTERMLTDDELFQACRGRTAHKGARHGLKLAGKLARLAQQEQELLEKLQQEPENITLCKDATKKKKKSKKAEPSEAAVEKIEKTAEVRKTRKRSRKNETHEEFSMPKKLKAKMKETKSKRKVKEASESI